MMQAISTFKYLPDIVSWMYCIGKYNSTLLCNKYSLALFPFDTESCNKLSVESSKNTSF